MAGMTTQPHTRLGPVSALLPVLLVWLMALPSWGQGVRPSEVIDAQLRPGWTTPDGTHVAALHLRLADGWMTYWRVPGEGGLALRMDWSGSGNITGLDKRWPSPQAVVRNGVTSIGYEGELVLPIVLTPGTRGQPMHLRADVTLGVCRDICMPVDMQIRGDFGAGSSTPDPVIQSAMTSAPGSARDMGLAALRCTMEPDAKNRMRLRVELDMPQIGQDERVIMELGDPALRIRHGANLREGDVLHADALIVPRQRQQPVIVDRSALRVTVLSDGAVVEHRGCDPS